MKIPPVRLSDSPTFRLGGLPHAFGGDLVTQCHGPYPQIMLNWERPGWIGRPSQMGLLKRITMFTRIADYNCAISSGFFCLSKSSMLCAPTWQAFSSFRLGVRNWAQRLKILQSFTFSTPLHVLSHVRICCWLAPLKAEGKTHKDHQTPFHVVQMSRRATSFSDLLVALWKAVEQTKTKTPYQAQKRWVWMSR